MIRIIKYFGVFLFCNFTFAQKIPLNKVVKDTVQNLHLKKERAKKIAIAEIKRRNGCTIPDPKKIHAMKAAQIKFKNNKP